MASGPQIVVFSNLTSGWTISDGWEERLATEIDQRIPAVSTEVAMTADEMKTAATSTEIAVTLELPPDLAADAGALRWIQALTAGVDNYDTESLAEAGIALTSASGVHSKPITQHVFGYLLAFERGIKRGIEQQHETTWESFHCRELTNQTLGIVGLGNIGRRVAEIGDAFRMSVIGTKRDSDVTIDHVDRVLPPDDLDIVLEEADYLVLSCSLTDQTRGLIGAAELAQMKDSAILVNIARGGVVEESDLVEALDAGGLRGAGLDVFETEPLPADSPLWDLSNVIVTPHNAGSGPFYWERCADIVARNYQHFVDGDLDAMTNRVV